MIFLDGDYIQNMHKYISYKFLLLEIFTTAILLLLCGCSEKNLPVDNAFQISKEQDMEISNADIEKNEEASESPLYEELKKSIVRLEIDKSAGSGIVWGIEDGKIIIVSSRHLIEQGDKTTVIVYDGTRLEAKTEGCSDISDVGFVSIEYENNDSDDILNKINVVCPRIYEGKQDISERDMEQLDINGLSDNDILEVIQIGSSEEPAGDVYTGYADGIIYVPQLGENMLQTKCYSKAGMSGGGVFDNEGFLLGMIAAGDVDGSGTENRDADTTYSIPVETIEKAYTERNFK